MSRWFHSFNIGQVADVRLPMADGPRWLRGTIVRRTQSGHPVVRINSPAPVVFVIDRKTDIRLVLP